MEPCAIVPLTHRDDVAAATAMVAGEVALVRVVRSVSSSVSEERIVVAAPPALAANARDCLRAAGLSTAVAVAKDAGSRQQMIRAGLEHLGAEPHSRVPVLICDHRYPLSPDVVVQRVLAALRVGHDVVLPTLAVTDTVKTIDDVGSVRSNVDRSTLQTVQYPRGFAASVLWQLDDADEFGAALRAGLDVGTVAGDANALHVELPRDAHLLDAIIACRRD